MGHTISQESHAIRYARAIASDICDYNEDKIVLGIQQDTVFLDMKEEIIKGKKLYEERVSSEIRDASAYFEQALVDIIFAEKGEQVPSKIW